VAKREITDPDNAADWARWGLWMREIEPVARDFAAIITDWQPAARPKPEDLRCENKGCNEDKDPDRRPTKYCGWCKWILAAHGSLPDGELLARKAAKGQGRVSTADVDAFVRRLAEKPRRRQGKGKRRGSAPVSS
jgi:hypothetical protein